MNDFLTSLPRETVMTAALGAAAVALAVFFLLYARQRRVCRQIGDLADRMNVCMEQLRTAETAAEYAGLWQQMEDDAEAIAAWQGRIRLWDRSIDLTAAAERVAQLRENYQWWLRDAMERQKDRALHEVKTTYRNSTEHKAAIYAALAEDWEGVSHLFSPETARFADGAMEEIYRAAGAGFERCAPFAGEPRPGEGERSAAVAEKLAWVDRMDGREFEYFCADLLRRSGFTDVDVTAGSGDQGVDILAQKDEIRYAFQCKCYEADLGNTPVQEIHAGKEIYDCHVGVVMTNRGFTAGAREAARRTRTLLWGRDKLAALIDGAE